MGDMKIYINEQMEKLKKLPLAMQYRQFKLLAEKHREMKVLTNLSDIAGRYHDIVIKINANNAILEATDPSFPDAPFTIVVDCKRTGHYYGTREEAMLGWIGYKAEGPNSRFHQYAYSAVKEGLENESM